MTVRKRGGHWYYDFQIKGVRYREAVPEARTKYQAEQAETKARDQVYQGTYGTVQLGNQDFSQFVTETYVPWAKANKRTWRNDEIIANQWSETFRAKALREVLPLAIEKWKRDRAQSITRRGTIRCPASVNMELAILSRIFTLAVELGQAASNPCSKVRKLRVDNQRNRYLSVDEEARLMAQLKGRRRHLYPLVALALGTGMRRGELLKLSWQHVDFLRGVINVLNTKTARNRIIPMSQKVREVLLAHQKAHKGDLVFASRRIAKRQAGKGLVDVKKAFVAACQDAGIADFHFHDLRHTFATRLGDAGCNATTIARLLGHSNIQMSMRYTHASDDSLRSAVELAQAERVANMSQTAKQPLTRVAVND
ncbi:MAG TPA: site-specific integrase [Pyrinomonadaceae bacterium]|nr:site-specific integrase [Pyrinomonadaceae bacterium]